MFEQLKAEIIKEISKVNLESGVFRLMPTAFGHRPVQQDVIDAIVRSKDASELLTAVGHFERMVVSFSNTNLAKLDPNKSLADQADKLKTCGEAISALTRVNILLSNNAPALLASGNLPKIQEIYNRIRIMQPDPVDERDLPRGAKSSDVETSRKNEMIFIENMRNTLLLSLLRTATMPSGSALIDRLHEIMLDRNHIINITTVYVGDPDSMAMSPIDRSKACAKPEPGAQNLALDVKLKRIIKVEGSGSILNVPVWTESESEYFRRRGVYFLNQRDLVQAQERVLYGSCVFDRNGTLTYIPFQLEIEHELIHALHNSRGTNRANIRMDHDMRRLWSTAEEYWSICCGKTNEWRLADDMGVARRGTHSALPAAWVIDPLHAAEAKITLNKLNIYKVQLWHNVPDESSSGGRDRINTADQVKSASSSTSSSSTASTIHHLVTGGDTQRPISKNELQSLGDELAEQQHMRAGSDRNEKEKEEKENPPREPEKVAAPVAPTAKEPAAKGGLSQQH